MNLRYIPAILISTAFGLLLSLALPASGDTWTSDPSRYFLGADVYPEKEIIAMKRGDLLKLSDGAQRADPIKFAEWIMSTGHLTKSESPDGVRYYVMPRLHPKLPLLVPALCVLGAGIIAFIILFKKKTV